MLSDYLVFVYCMESEADVVPMEPTILLLRLCWKNKTSLDFLT